MPLNRRLLLLLLAVLLSVGHLVSAAAQDSGPGPNDPVAFPTPGDDGTGGDNTGGDSGDENSAPAVDNPTVPWADEKIDLAAVPLAQDTMPAGFGEYGEFHLSVDEVKTRYSGQLEPEQVDATGLTGYYQSDFNDGQDETIIITVLAFAKASDVQAGFDLFNNQETFFPNGNLTDDDALPDVGEGPGETYSGQLENGDGTRTNVYAATFTVGPLLITVEMDGANEADPDSGAISDLAALQADRAEDALDSNAIDGITYGLGNLMVYPTEMFHAFDGYGLADEDFLLRTMNSTPDGFISAYASTYRLTERGDSFYPLYSATVASFASAAALDDLFANPDDMMVAYDELKQIDDPDIAGADATAAFTYDIGEGSGSVRVFAQAGSYLIIVDIEGATDMDDALTIATGYAAANVACASDGDCAAPTGLPNQTATPDTTDFFP